MIRSFVRNIHSKKTGRKMKILGVGSPIVDVLVNIDDDFLKNIRGDKGGMEYVDVSDIETILKKAPAKPISAPGGSCANTILALTKLGLKTGFLGKVGNDKQGLFYTENYKFSGGDTNQFKITDKVRTGQCMSLVTPDSQRTMRTYLGAAATISEEDILPEDFEGYTHLHVEGYMLHNHAVIKKVLRLAKEANLIVSLDLASFEVVHEHRDVLADLLKSYVDIVFSNEDEAKAYVQSENPEELFDALDGVCDTIIVKFGKDGAMIKSGDIKVRVNALIVDAVDTTGAGDLWQAGFLYGYTRIKKLSGKLLEKAGGFGSILGAEVVQIMGANIPDERWDEIRKRLV